jgi:hypothetical protein
VHYPLGYAPVNPPPESIQPLKNSQTADVLRLVFRLNAGGRIGSKKGSPKLSSELFIIFDLELF